MLRRALVASGHLVTPRGVETPLHELRAPQPNAHGLCDPVPPVTTPGSSWHALGTPFSACTGLVMTAFRWLVPVHDDVGAFEGAETSADHAVELGQDRLDLPSVSTHSTISGRSSGRSTFS